ncbi:hypothetical protein NMG60_11014340 [Bertholletia excelsa]
MMMSNRAKIDVSTWDGTISSRDFQVAALAFAEKWKRLNSTILPQWSWVSSPKRPWIASHEGEGYLSLENVILHGLSQEGNGKVSHTKEEESSCCGLDDAIDHASLVQTDGREVICFDFHIVYSSSYRVPVLYFRACSSDGQPLVLDDVIKDLPANSVKVLLESKWTFLTQEEHPYLNRPWYKLHPCGTCEWIKLLLLADASGIENGVAFERYIVSWLSVVGQVVGLRIPFEMLKDCGDV